MNAEELFQHWSAVRAGLIAGLDKLADAQLDFTPRDGLWSLRETVVHIAGTEDGWLRCYTANQWHANPPEAKNYPTLESLKRLLAEAHARTQAQFAQEADRLLEQVCQLPWGAREHGVGGLARAGARDPPPRRDIPDAGPDGHRSPGRLAGRMLFPSPVWLKCAGRGRGRGGCRG